MEIGFADIAWQPGEKGREARPGRTENSPKHLSVTSRSFVRRLASWIANAASSFLQYVQTKHGPEGRGTTYLFAGPTRTRPIDAGSVEKPWGLLTHKQNRCTARHSHLPATMGRAWAGGGCESNLGGDNSPETTARTVRQQVIRRYLRGDIASEGDPAQQLIQCRQTIRELRHAHRPR